MHAEFETTHAHQEHLQLLRFSCRETNIGLYESIVLHAKKSQISFRDSMIQAYRYFYLL